MVPQPGPPAPSASSGRRSGVGRWFGVNLGKLGVQPRADLVGRVGAALPLGSRDDHAGRGHTRDTGQSEHLPPPHVPRLRPVPTSSLRLAEALDLTRTGDLWLFRGSSAADRAIRVTTNSPVNHVGMAVVIDDLPPLMWHAELGKSLVDMWSGQKQRGVQLHDLRQAVLVWATRYGQRAWLRQLDTTITPGIEDAVLRTIARLDGTPFPSTKRLASGWLRGRVPVSKRGERDERRETAYCAEVVAVTYGAMGLLGDGRGSSFYDPGRFWSGDDLNLSDGARLSDEIAVDVPLATPP